MFYSAAVLLEINEVYRGCIFLTTVINYKIQLKHVTFRCRHTISAISVSVKFSDIGRTPSILNSNKAGALAYREFNRVAASIQHLQLLRELLLVRR